MTTVARHAGAEVTPASAPGAGLLRLTATWTLRGLVVDALSGPRFTGDLGDAARLVVTAELERGRAAPGASTAAVEAHVEDDIGRRAPVWRGEAQVVEDAAGRLVHVDAPGGVSATWRLDAHGQALYARTTLLERMGVRAGCGEVGRG